MTPSSPESFFSSSGSDEGQRPWSWRCHDASGAVTSPASAAGSTFPTQADAESWLGEAWRDLLDEGVESVTLLEGEREVYGPMGLRA
jgi:hypothetical protein